LPHGTASFAFISTQTYANHVCKSGRTRLKYLTTKRPQNTTKIYENPFLPALGNGHDALPALAQGTQLGLPSSSSTVGLVELTPRCFRVCQTWHLPKLMRCLKNPPLQMNLTFLISNVSGRNRIEIDLGFKFFLHVLQPKNRSTCIGQHELQTTLD